MLTTALTGRNILKVSKVLGFLKHAIKFFLDSSVKNRN